jgi:3'-5' exoribonuclease
MGKVTFIEDLAVGETFNDLLMVKSARMGETRAGKPYLVLNLGDRSGEISGPVWENAEAYQDICVSGAVVRVKGQVQTYNEKLQLKIDNVSAADEQSYEMEAFIASSHRGAETMQDELRELISTVQNSFLRKLLERLFVQGDTGKIYRQSPAAKGIHHAYMGGLLEHSLSMAKVALMLAGHYEGIDSDLLVAGALLHDIGKTVELQNATGVIDYTDTGRLKGHLVIGCEMIGREAEHIKGFPGDLLAQLQHLVLSHHGRQEFGSPVVPMTAEALLLSFIDDMDAKMNLVEQLRRKVKSDGMQWSEYQRSLERYLLLKPLADQQEETPSRVEEPAPNKQRSLF